MKIPYIKIPITDMYAYLACCPSAVKGEIFGAVLHYGMYQAWPALALPPDQQQAYAVVQEMIEKEIKSYKQYCKTQKQKAKKMWDKKQNSVQAVALPPWQSQSKQETKQEPKPETENINTLTAQPAAAQGACEKNLLQEFAARVAQRFEPDVQTPVQREIWFKRNARCLRDIYQFCDRNITLALQTISVCANRLSKAGLTGGYEAVCRNLPEYYARAKSQEEQPHAG